jgi:hypothetical protein
MRGKIRYFKIEMYFGPTWMLTETRNEDVADETKPCKRNRKYRDGPPHYGPTLHQRGIKFRSVIHLRCRHKDDKTAVGLTVLRYIDSIRCTLNDTELFIEKLPEKVESREFLWGKNKQEETSNPKFIH